MKIDEYVVWTAIITPLLNDSSVDYESLEKLLRAQAAAGNGITILGSTGEALNLDDKERKEILDFALGLKLDVPFMVGVGGININEQKAWVEYLNNIDGLDAYLLVVPPYAKPGIHGQHQWFKALMDLAKRPCVLYNVPGRTCKKLEFESVKMLVDHPKFWAIKEASGSLEDFKKFVEIAPKAHMLSGEDGMLPEQCKLGCAGVVSVVSNVWPEAAHEWAKQSVAGKLNEPQVWLDAADAIFSATSPIPAKALLHDLGRIKTPTLRLPLSIDDMSDVNALIKANQEVESWYAKQPNN